MRALIAIALVLSAGIASFWMWGTGHAQRVADSSSQIFIHGTPVCVIQRGGEIQAAVGVCGNFSADPNGGSGRFHEADPNQGNPHGGLPPGHPPIGDGPFPSPEEGRRTRTLI